MPLNANKPLNNLKGFTIQSLNDKSMTTKIDAIDLGYKTWLDVFKSVKTENLDCNKVIVFNFEKKDHLKPIEMSVSMIKAKAFDEIFETLPLKDSVDVITELLIECRDLTGAEQRLVFNFIKKVPTRQE
jgi:hypothetical protein